MEKKTLKIVANSDDLILCFTCKKYCIEDNPPHYDIFKPPSYSEISKPPMYSEI